MKGTSWHARLQERYNDPSWNVVRGKLMVLHGGKCQQCGAIKWLQAHHTPQAYKYLWHEEEHLDLMRLWCRECHSAWHGHRTGFRPRNRFKNPFAAFVQEVMKEVGFSLFGIRK